MKFVLASYGTRGDIEPGAAVGRELLRRGHEVSMAVPPDLVGFVEAAGLAAVGYGLDTRAQMDAYRNFWTCFFRRLLEDPESGRVVARILAACQPVLGGDEHDADVAGRRGRSAVGRRELPGGRCKRRGVSRYSVRHLPVLPDTRQWTAPSALPSPLVRSPMTALEWLDWRIKKKIEDAQRRELGLPKATRPLPRRIVERGSLESRPTTRFASPG